MQAKRWGAWILLLGMLVVCAGCGSDDEDANGADFTGEIGESASAMITAADGGTLQTESGSVLLTVPAGALAEDIELSVETLAVDEMPDAANLGSYVFEFGPDGTEFSEAVTLELAFAGSVPEGKQAMLAVLADGAWETITGSALADGKVTGAVNHFSRFVIRFTDEGSEITTEDQICQDMPFTACGGDIVGEWEVETLCLSGTLVGGDNPWADLDESCQDTVFGMELTWGGTITLNGDGTFSQYLTSVVNYFFEFDQDCLTYLAESAEQDFGDTPEAVCQYASEESDMGPCIYADQVCSCETAPSDDPYIIDMSGTYSTDGNNLEVTSEGNTSSVEYCRDGDYLLAEWAMSGDEDGLTDYLILKKK